MSRLARRMPVILRKLDAASEALSELDALMRDDPRLAVSREQAGRDDGIYRLRRELNEISTWLDRARWWRDQEPHT